MNASMTVGAPSAPATLSVKTGATTTVTVTVSATTTVVRRYNGPSGLDELTVGDHVSAWGAMDSSVAGQFDAERVKDWSIQKAYTRAVGAIQTINADGSFALTVVGDRTRHSAYRRGEVVQVSLSSTCTIMSGGAPVAAAGVTWQPGTKVLVMGLYDRLGHTLKADRVRILAVKHRGNGGSKAATPRATPTATP